MVLTLHRGWVALGALSAGLGFAALVFWASAPLDISARVAPAAAPAAVISSIATQTREVALTFDDGPSPQATPAILRLLDQYGAKATFFVLGSEAEHFPAIIEMIHRDGDELGNHAMTHRSLAGMRPSRVAYELSSTAGLIQELTGTRPLFFRPPYGNLSPVVISAAANLHETVTLWTIDTRDWTGRSAAAITTTVLSDIRPGAIVLMHDGGGPRGRTVKALRSILAGLRARGYRAVTLQTLVHDSMPENGATPAAQG